MTRQSLKTQALSVEAISLLNLPPLSRLLVQVGFALARWEMRQRTRGALNRLDPHLLRDIGIGPDERASECALPFWRD